MSKINQVKLSDVAVIIATKNEGEHLQKCIESVLSAGQGQIETIVINDGSTDASQAILDSFEGQIQVLQGGGKGPGHARNLGIESTRRSWVAFTDGDCVVHQDWLKKLCHGISNQTEDFSSIGGVQVIYRNAGKTEREVGEFLQAVGFVSDYLHASGSIRSVAHNPTCNVLYKKETIESVEGFDESLWPCEDLELDLRLKKKGFKALYHPKAIVEHRRPGSLKGFAWMMHRYGFGHGQLVKKHGFCQKIHILAFLPFLFIVLGMLIPKLGNALFLTLILLGSAVSGGFFAGLFGFYRKTASWKKAIKFILLTGLSIIMWILGFYYGLISSKQIAKL